MTTEDEHDMFEERAAIRQYQSGQSRYAAEKGAREDVEREKQRRAAKQASTGGRFE